MSSWSGRYLMNLKARGRPLPSGQPEDLLWEALQRLDAHGLDQALQAGASVHARDVYGRSAFHALLDAGEGRKLPFQPGEAVERLMRALIRHGARTQDLHPRKQQTVVERLLGQGTPVAVNWVRQYLPRDLALPFRGRMPLEALLATGQAAAIAAFPADHPQWEHRGSDGQTLRQRWAARQESQITPVSPGPVHRRPAAP